MGAQRRNRFEDRERQTDRDPEKIAKDNRVYGVYDVTGDYDSMVLARGKDRDDLDDLIKNVLVCQESSALSPILY